VVKRIFPNSSDFENLSRLRTEGPAQANEYDYTGVVVRKPWGYEYLWHQNAAVAIWMLHLTAGSATSLHCHARKRTSLIVMAGTVMCSTFDDRFLLGPGQAIVLESCVFHTTRAQSAGGAFVMEVETPPLKGDVLRYRDDFGRAGQGYEDPRQYSTTLSDFDHQPLRQIKHEGRVFPFKETRLQVRSCQSQADLAAHLVPGGVIVPMLGKLSAGEKLVADIGEAIPVSAPALARLPAVFPPVELLQIFLP
jgi:mannose-6-phosphate isomerase-like protein (cupin superfamily)